MSCFLGLNPNKFPLAIMHAKNISNTWAILVTIKDSSRQNLHEGICHVLHKSNLLHSHISSQYYLTYQMILSLNMVIFGWFLSSLNRVTTPLLSQNSIGGDRTKGTTPSPIRNLWSQTTSFDTSEATTYSTFIVDSTIQNRFTLFQLIAPLLRVNTKLKVDLW